MRYEGELETYEKPVVKAYALADNRSTPAEIPQYLSAWTGLGGAYIMYLPTGEYYTGLSTFMPTVPKEELSTSDRSERRDGRIEIIEYLPSEK